MAKVIPNLKVFFLLIFFSLVILLIDTVNFLDLPKKWMFYITNPVSFGIYNSSRNVSKQFYFVSKARFAAQENKALKEQIGKLISENADLRKRVSEATAQISQERHLDPRTYNMLSARPIGLSRYLKIDQGSDSGLKAGEAVVFEDNFIGRIISVTPGSSNIQLLTDPDSKIAAFSQNKDGKAKGVLTGQFGTELILDKILHEEKIEIGDLVYSEGLEGFLPRGLILGRVIEVFERQNEVFKQAKVKPVFDIRDLELVFVIIE